MNRAHSVIAGACSWLAGHTGALIIGFGRGLDDGSPEPHVGPVERHESGLDQQ
jgi:hypothetical protein